MKGSERVAKLLKVRVTVVEGKRRRTIFVQEVVADEIITTIEPRNDGVVRLSPDDVFPWESIGGLRVSLLDYFKRAEIIKVSDLLRYSAKELLNFPGFGPDTLARVESLLALSGLMLRQEQISPESQIEALDLRSRTVTILRANGIHTVSDLTARTQAEIKSFPGIGRKALEEIRATLHHHGEQLRGVSS